MAAAERSAVSYTVLPMLGPTPTLPPLLSPRRLAAQETQDAAVPSALRQRYSALAKVISGVSLCTVPVWGTAVVALGPTRLLARTMWRLLARARRALCGKYLPARQHAPLAPDQAQGGLRPWPPASARLGPPRPASANQPLGPHGQALLLPCFCLAPAHCATP